MGINIGPPEVDELRPRIAVIGVGGAGGNAIANMIAANVEGVDFIVANTDAQALNASAAESRIQLGPDITQGLGAGSRPEIGRAAAEETILSVEQALEGAHMCFIAAGMGGGTGTGAAPVIAKAARDRGILTVGVVTKPFTFEGSRRMRSADAGIEELQANVDTLIVIPNQNLFLVANPNTTFKEAFQMADEVLQQGVRGITDLMVMPGLINLDFADVRSVMHEMGKAMMGTGEAEGDGRALEAAEKAIANPLLDGVSMRGAKGVIISITGGEDMRLMEVDEAANHIRELVDPEANIIWGSAFNDSLEGKIRVSVVATGIDADADADRAPVSRAFSFPPRKQAPEAPAETAPTSIDEAPADDDAVTASDSADGSADQATGFASDHGFDDGADEDTGVSYDAPPPRQGFAPAAPHQPEATPSYDDTGSGADHGSSADADAEPLELSDEVDSSSSDDVPPFRPAATPKRQAIPTYDDTAPEPIPGLSIRDRLRQSQDDGQQGPAPADDELVLDSPTTPAPAASSAKGGGTLFERMSRLSRGAPKSDAESDGGDDDGDALEIPRFLNRQNNQ
ncbi:cell division protein FtsZ [Sphingorhabdus soli]|uniref:Cell division protein FtsZ n=1 Tax=Flavisphingopyxis soli TaxID=2601267 RepID=A0A5C6U720_9SPHN|nr:cell division protein FtsZ [Sphingorhabdus soli]TXC68737.1 cell division protein FtsZ [Sphingorhabdus soli]